jgi:elongation factor Tu
MTNNIHNPVFELVVEDIFSFTGKGTLVTGKVTRGAVRVGTTLSLITTKGERHTVRIISIEAFRKVLTEALMGENVGLLLEGLPKQAISLGDRVSFE